MTAFDVYNPLCWHCAESVNVYCMITGIDVEDEPRYICEHYRGL